jgi:hypothetical protein
MSGSGASGNKFRMSVSFFLFKKLFFCLTVGLSVPGLFSEFDFVNMDGVDVDRDLRGLGPCARVSSQQGYSKTFLIFFFCYYFDKTTQILRSNYQFFGWERVVFGS